MLRYYLTILLSLLLAPFVVFAAYTDVTLEGATVITVGGYNLTVTGSVTLDSITVNANDLSLILSKSAHLTVTSSDRRSFTVSPAQYQESFSCGTSESSVTVANNLWDEAITVTVTPSSGVCSVDAGGGGAGGAGGGGGGGSAVPDPVYTVIPGTQAAAVVEAVTPTGVSVPTTPSVGTPTVSVGSVFVSGMSRGVSSVDVKRLQQLLNSDSDTAVASSGVGSAGQETEYFGSLTEKAVQKFQLKYSVVASASDAGYGYVGPKTRAKLAEVFVGVTEVEPQVAPAAEVQPLISAAFTYNMGKGVSSADVKRLQQLLATDSEIYPEGLTTGYFGLLTQSAVQKFQLKYGVVSSASDAGYGNVGPKTRAKLAEVFADVTEVEPQVAPAAEVQPQSVDEAAALEIQIQGLLQQLEDLQAELNAM